MNRYCGLKSSSETPAVRLLDQRLPPTVLPRRTNQEAFRPRVARSRFQTPPNPLRAKSNFVSHFNAIWVVQIARQKYIASHFPQINSMFTPSRLIEEGRTRRHDTWSAGCGGRDGVARARHCRAASSLSWGCERLIRAGRAALLRTAKACGSGTRGWCQAGGGCSNPTGFVGPSIRQRRRQKEFVSGKSAP